MTTARGGASRCSSARPASVARTVQKRRDKPFQVEKSRVVAKKRKLGLYTTYTNAPPGFTFLPVGTPDLAERCKEISRQRALPVHVVNAKPASKQANDPDKVSHHIRRIGYHFRSDVVEDACQQLGYIPNRGRFVKEAELAAENEKSRMARALAKHGIHLDEPAKHETDEQVRAAVKELFPKIPEEDLQAILQRAWARGSQRVGTNSTIELPRRVQLATIARIRHTYTDYDRLLRAFEWKEARSLVEPTCLKKLIEWRGEHDEETDNELEEIVRETIVIDDDDDDANVRNGSGTDDKDSTAELDQDYASDTSLEIIDKPAGAEDLGAESHDEQSRRFLDRFQPPLSNVQQRYRDVQQKIGAMRQQLRSGPPAAEANVVRVHIPETKDGGDTVIIGGQLFRRAPAPSEVLRSPVCQISAHASPESAYGLPRDPAQPGLIEPYQPQYNKSAAGRSFQDRPVASIEPPDELRRLALASASARAGTRSQGSRPESPFFDSPGKRHRMEQLGPSAYANPNQAQPPSPIGSGAYVSAAQVINVPYQPSPPQTDRGSPFMDNSGTRRAEVRPLTYMPPGSPSTNGSADGPAQGEKRPPSDASRQPQLPHYQQDDSAAASRPEARHGFVDAQVAPIQYVPLPPQGQDQYGRTTYARLPAQEYPRPSYQNAQRQPRFAYVEPSRQYTPVHGAPAAVQLVPTPAPAPALAASGAYKYPQPATVQVPATYAPRPTDQPQYYYPR